LEQGRSERVAARHAELARTTGWAPAIANEHAARLPDSYWIAEPPEWQLANARQIENADLDSAPSIVADDDPQSGGTRVSVFAADSPGLFYRIAAGLAAAGASIFDARIHTTYDGMALDNLLVQDRQGRAYADKRLRDRLIAAVAEAIGGDVPALPEGSEASRAGPFQLAPRVLIAEGASSRTTVVEVNARDRPALLARLAGAIHDAGLVIHSAHIATYGERAVDVFYLTDVRGKKLAFAQAERLRVRLLEVAGQAALRTAQAAG
jgi:[protein-PII] uridylyltransferase